MGAETRRCLRTLNDEDLKLLADRNAPTHLRNQVMFNALPKEQHPGLRYGKDFAEFELERRERESREAERAVDEIQQRLGSPLSELDSWQRGALLIAGAIGLMTAFSPNGSRDESAETEIGGAPFIEAEGENAGRTKPRSSKSH